MGSKMTTINKCFSFLKEMQLRANSGIKFDVTGTATKLKCSPVYYKIAIELGYFKLQTDGMNTVLKPLFPEILFAQAEKVVAEANSQAKYKVECRKKDLGDAEKRPCTGLQVLDQVSTNDLVVELINRGCRGTLMQDSNLVEETENGEAKGILTQTWEL